MKKLMMVLTMAVAAAMSAWATTESANGYTWTYTASDGKATITAVSPEPSGDVKIPSSFNRGLARVTAIGESVFSGCGDMTYVTLPEKLEHIGPYAFKNCTGLVVLQLPPTVKYIDYQAFCDCTGLLSVIFGTSSAMSVLRLQKSDRRVHQLSGPLEMVREQVLQRVFKPDLLCGATPLSRCGIGDDDRRPGRREVHR